MKKNCMTIIAILLVAALLAACSGGGAEKPENTDIEKSEAPAGNTDEQVTEKTSEAPAGALIEPEQLISKEEAAALVGEVKDGEKSEQPVVGLKIMFYETADEEGLLQVSITQQAFMSVEGNTPESIYIALKDAVASENAETADGIGDEYFFGTLGLHILYKDYYISLDAGNSEDPDVRKILKQAGAKAVANLEALIG